MLDGSTLALAGILYLLAFFLIAWATERGKISSKIVQHPALYVLSLSVIVSTWSFYTAYISAENRGLGFNAYYLGFAGAFLLAPFLLQPILRVTRRFQLASLADLFAFRFRSAWAGTLTTCILFLCIFPLLALQFHALAGSAILLAPTLPSPLIGLAFLLFLCVFALRFGTPDASGRESNTPLVASLAFEGLFKIFMLLMMGTHAVFAIFGGVPELQQWLETQPPEVTRLEISFMQDSSNILILLFFTAAVAMPHVFHVIFHENRDSRALRTASWALPLYLLLASLPVLPTLWAYESLGASGNPQFVPLHMGIAAEARLVTLLYFTGGIASATGVSVVLAIAVANMGMNHIVLRLQTPPAGVGLYDWLLLRKRMLMVGILGTGYLLHLLIADGRWVVDIGSVSFIACLQFLPGLITLLYWPAANRSGFIAGLTGGLLVWLLLGLLPFVGEVTGENFALLSMALDWTQVGSASLLTNLALLLVISLLTETSTAEKHAARLCASGSQIAMQPLLKIRNVSDFISGLSPMLGVEAASREVTQALHDLHLNDGESRAFALLQLRARLEANLSALLGPTLANHLIEHAVPIAGKAVASTSEIRTLLEQGLDAVPVNLSGIALALDALRRQYRQALLNLPLGVCELDEAGQIVLWNALMVKVTGIGTSTALGSQLAALPAPWGPLLDRFVNDQATKLDRQPLAIDGKTRWLGLHKALVHGSHPPERAATLSAGAGQIVLVEDRTDTILMENELAHTDRLNSIGRLAAGVAHEIGNPVTGIACLAQNLRDEYEVDDIQDLAEQILGQTRRIATITDTLLRFSHSGGGPDTKARVEAVDLHEVTAQAFKLLNLSQEAHDVTLVNACSPGQPIAANAQQLLQVLLNLLSNAQHASPAGATIHVTSRQEGKLVHLAVTDHGSGIPESLIEKVFDPFFTTKDPGQGTGLGLALVHRLVTDLGGSVQIESPPRGESEGKGTRVIVTFPCYDPGNFVTS